MCIHTYILRLFDERMGGILAANTRDKTEINKQIQPMNVQLPEFGAAFGEVKDLARVQ